MAPKGPVIKRPAKPGRAFVAEVLGVAENTSETLAMMRRSQARKAQTNWPPIQAPDRPNWAGLLVDLCSGQLKALAQLQAGSCGPVRVQSASDCAGMGMDIYALKEFACQVTEKTGPLTVLEELI